jgi:hypothetical protein
MINEERMRFEAKMKISQQEAEEENRFIQKTAKKQKALTRRVK